MAKIDTSFLFEEFKNHLDIADNNRILFSAPFGTGKSTYLKDFFEHFKTEYNVVKIFPANYSVSSNEDIFELIKYDILVYLIHTLNVKLNIEEFDESLYKSTFISEKVVSLGGLTSIISKLNLNQELGLPSIIDILFKITTTLTKNYQDFKKEIKNQQEDKQLINFLEYIESDIKTHFRYNDITSIIKNSLDELKQENVKTVLLIDDLDRLDPEHIFRLFNIFSAHHNEIDNKNKFGFDKVIFVCDYNNIKNIYAHKYGSNTDFNGYINKFYAEKTYLFRFDDCIIRGLDKLYVAHTIPRNLYEIITDILRNLNEYGLLNYRDFSNKDIKLFEKRGLIKINQLNISMNNKIVELYYYLVQIFPPIISKLKRLMEVTEIKLYNQEGSSWSDNMIYSYSVAFLLEKSIINKIADDNTINPNQDARIYEFNFYGIKIRFSYNKMNGISHFHILDNEAFALIEFKAICQALINLQEKHYNR